MNAQIQTLLNTESMSQFHLDFEAHFGLSPKVRARFNHDSLLFAIRQAYLWEYCAEHAGSIRDKIFYYHDALQVLKGALERVDSNVDQASLLFLCHSIAKIHYQTGVQWMTLDQDAAGDMDLVALFTNQSALTERQQVYVDKLSLIPRRIIQEAMASFTDGLTSYASFVDRHNVADEQSFYALSQSLHKQFEDLDDYSPWARLISLGCNHFLCAQEDMDNDSSNAVLLDKILARIKQYRDDKQQKGIKNSPSAKAIAEVEDLLESFIDKPQPSKPASKVTGKKSVKSSPKGRITSMGDWKPEMTNRVQFNESFRQNTWTIPDFLRPRQKEDIQIIFQSFVCYERPLMVTKPTGTGKTAEFSVVTNGAWNNGVPTIIVVPTATLVEQTYTKLLEYKKHDGMVYDVDHIGMFCPTKKNVSVGPITIVTQSSYVCQAAKALKRFPTQMDLYDFIQNNPNACLQKEVMFHPEFFSLMIIDEGHHMEGDKLFALMTRPGCYRPKILFSASTLPGEYERIDTTCQHIITQSLREAIISNELAPMQALTVDFSMYPEACKLTKSIRARMQDKSEKAELDEESRREIAAMLTENAGFSLTATSILKQVMENVSSSRKAMVFTDSIDHANLLATLLSNLFNRKIGAYHTQSTDRDAVLSDFSTNKSPVIVAVGALDEGFDDSNVNLILDFSIYKVRIRRMIQRLGRALRLREDGSGAILISIKLLPHDLQLIPRDEILGAQEQSYLGLVEEAVLDVRQIQLTLPEPLKLDSDSETMVIPQGAAIVFPKNRKPVKLGSLPEEDVGVENVMRVVKKQTFDEYGRFFSSALVDIGHKKQRVDVAIDNYDQHNPDMFDADMFDAFLGVDWNLV